MPRACFVPGCRTHKAFYERGVAMFTYPRDPKLVAAWNVACSRSENSKPPRHACVCEKHFDPAEINGKSGRRSSLQQGAVPSRFLDGSRTEEEIDGTESSFEAADQARAMETLNVEEVFIQAEDELKQVPELEHLELEKMCRVCGMKQEQKPERTLDELSFDEKGESLLALCLLAENESLETIQRICSRCFTQISSFLEFLKMCYNGQRLLFERLLENEQAVTTEQAQSDSGDATDESQEIATDEDVEKLSVHKPQGNETDEMRDSRIDRYIDGLITKLKSEKRTSILPREWECLDCREIFQHRNHLAIHRRTCALVGSRNSKRYGPFGCQLCDKEFKTLPGFRHHLLKMHDRDKIRASGGKKNTPTTVDESDENYPEELRSLKSRKIVICPICNDTFRTCGELRYHLPAHKSVNKEKGLKSSQEMSSEEGSKEIKQFMCSFCGKMERSHAGLEIHMKFHLKQKDWACEICAKRYYTKADLRQHVLSVHEKFTYTCDDCGTVLNSRATFTRHKRLHNESQLKKCTFCVKKFTTSNALKRHVESRHLGQKRPRVHAVEVLEHDAPWKDADELPQEELEEIVIAECVPEDQGEPK
ncbi:zinc finger and BTB domain-containing protein 41-like [Toxorhynchites rutilus septentrionalis]|uniref:zinc finger and BTB domain-containing protein 41-like n=1 Tax=Toxorhynchites rutilus septentrionalis TaxID=329112 RepID=UPI00247A53D4|nr:zinc finger and BTB domain-containing protein 41-like [Toxorhynchites rutilus septentrionalis]XP_055623866.1 zinc finger and BTB domain-containing protein 41-like [Toxorhynchites rutilus septentrionalis]XP_055623874.1 zinc finger and BTB domain-containing protein 41-like [Toxorhynchites rutilus septentrionalis]XP_055623884.1 zinc finger and BTB domain-containing protein 41-like [Toxorhynchites rutilus septentrionalis]XP_055623893.1 zinc finger and BTB domain-containing protein 41-like [Toxor